MPLQYSDPQIQRARLTLLSIKETIEQLIDWNQVISSSEDYYLSQAGMQLLAANCTLITAIGEGVNRVNRVMPDFLQSAFPVVPWRDIIGMRNHIAHGYFELDADLVFQAIKNDMPSLLTSINSAINILE